MKHQINNAVLSYGSNHYPIEAENLLRFPQTLEQGKNFEETVKTAVATLRMLSGGFNLKLTLTTVTQTGIMLEGDGWRIQYGFPKIGKTNYPHHIVDHQLRQINAA